MDLEKIWESRVIDETYFLILAVLLAFGILQTTGTLLGTEKAVVTVISTSMCPALQVGDILVVKGESFSDIEEQDIIVYEVPDRVSFTIDGERYDLERYREDKKPGVETAAGEISLRSVQPSRDRSRDVVLLEFDGELPEFEGGKTGLEEGSTYTVNGKQISIDYATTLPREGVPIVHRVVSKSEGSLETLGDNNREQLEFEDSVKPEQIHGKVFFKIPRVGLLKIVAMDLIGYSGDKPLALDATPSCG